MYTWRRAGASPRPTLRVSVPSSVGTAVAAEPNNLYFSETSEQPLPLTRSWSAVLWPPT